jgi:preprotein translocase subunit YajC
LAAIPETLLRALVLAAEPAPAAPGMDAPAGDSGGGSGGGGMTQTLMLFGAIFLIFYFLVIRPQGRERKKREAMLKAVGKHDKVVTTAGIHGSVVSVADDAIVLEVDDGVRLKFDRSAVWKVVSSASEGASKP